METWNMRCHCFPSATHPQVQLLVCGGERDVVQAPAAAAVGPQRAVPPHPPPRARHVRAGRHRQHDVGPARAAEVAGAGAAQGGPGQRCGAGCVLTCKSYMSPLRLDARQQAIGAVVTRTAAQSGLQWFCRN